ncbi:acyl-CoA-like ligand-binding transcription factor [Nocardia sp. CDC160]|uniref:acyl-CoA-like ligand-binding transcription factor n=1 Tax=Nocardia sp. CDC160 TaxID=3112166 RepID=UPI002DBB91E5|nr:TetR family transcriptional regulator [Nocardia sp. CDC160]MEC3913130.1 TetR family transcriptional regulator [Nocardia sp. CDC160]
MSADIASATPPAPVKTKAGGGLRERKKERTRRTIRVEAFRLFREQGYTETTVEQIAAAADISPSTFFRYFPSKEQVAMADDLDPVMIASFESQPKELSVLAAFKKATLESFDALSPEDREFERQRVELLSKVPELRGAIGRELERSNDLIADLVSRRTGRSPDDFEVRIFAGALSGAMLGFIDHENFGPEQIVRVLDFLEAGMPL